jgi:S-adenosylmethionine decarboxylase
LETFGKHVIAELWECQNIKEYDDEIKLKALLSECALLSNATILSISTHKFEPQGISGLVYLAESHFSVHTFPEHSYAAVDFYTCGVSTNPLKGIVHFVNKMGSDKPLYTTVKRGVLNNSSFNKRLVRI